MKNTNKILLISILIIAGIIAFLKFGKEKSTRIDRYDFKVENTNEINKIVLTSKKPEKAMLDLKDGKWMINNRYPARESAVKMLLKTISTMEVQNPVLKEQRSNIFKDMASSGLKVEVYKQNKITKTFYVGTDGPNKVGTYMLLANAEAPYVVNVPGHNGFLSTRFYTAQNLWRSKEIFSLEKEKLKMVKMIYHNDPKNNFSLIKNGNNFSLLNAQGKENKFEPIKASAYIAGLKQINCETIVKSTDKKLINKINNSPKLFSFIITDTENKTTEFTGFLKNTLYKTEDGKGYYEDKDPDRIYVTNGTDYYAVQLLIFDKFIKRIVDFQ